MRAKERSDGPRPSGVLSGSRQNAHRPIDLDNLTAESLLSIQHDAGNAAATLLVQRLAEGAATGAATGAAADHRGDAPKEDLGAAKKEFDLGAEAYDARDYENAYLHFRTSYLEANRSAQPAIAFSIAQCCRRLDRYLEAQDWFEEYLASGETHRKADAEDALREMKAKAAALRGEGDVVAPEPGTPELGAAKKEFEAAEAAYKAKDYETARTHFLTCYAEVDRKVQPVIAFNLGQSCRFTHRFAEGITWFEEYLASGETKRKDDAIGVLAECRVGQASDKGESLPASGPDLGAAKEEFYAADKAYEAHDYESARTHFFAAYRLADSKTQPVIAFDLAQACRHGGRYEEAISYYKEYLVGGDGKRKADALDGIRACRYQLDSAGEEAQAG